PLFSQAEELLALLHAKEQSLIRHELWRDLQPWMNHWQMEHLLAAGAGSSRPRLRFAPKLPPYSTYYRKWREPSPSAVLASEVIAGAARRGAFASLFEVQAAFEGAWRLLNDPAHGLVMAQRRALAAAKQADPARFGGASLEIGSGPLKVVVLS